MTPHNRRTFLGISAALATTAALSPVTAATADTDLNVPEPLPVLPGYAPKIGSAWIAKGKTESATPLVDRLLTSVSDFSWLAPGDRVLLKLALNSGKVYPATSDPWLVRSLIEILRAKGAGEILVGDQSGVEAVFWQRDQQRGSSRMLCQSAGLLAVIEEAGATPVFFEELGYDAYVRTEPQGGHHWSSPLWVTAVVNQVDHIIYVPRVASHIMGDITAGLKLGVGFLREDSRLAFHRGGAEFYAMYEEINQVPEIQRKLRLIVTSGRKVLTTIGPDMGDVAEPDPGLLMATDDLLANELLSYAWLQWNRQFQTSGFARATKGNLTRFRSFINRQFIDQVWEPSDGIETPEIPVFRPGSIYGHPALVNRMIRQGGRPERLDWQSINSTADTAMLDHLHQQLAV
jgi:uncharacterized protein (DUF362 family)